MSYPSVCWYYTRGSCWFGDRCWNLHYLGTVHTDSPNNIMDEASTSAEEINFVVGARRETTPMTASPNRSNYIPRQRNQVLSDSANKSSETHEIAPSASKDKWCLKNIKTGETRAGSPDSLLVETTKELNKVENLIVSLREQLRVKNEVHNFSWFEHQMEQCLRSDLQCNICYELFIEPTVLNCSHTFCHECIESWTRSVNNCPTCRAYVINKSYCLTLNTYLDKIAESLPDEIKTRRETLKVERNNNKEVNRSQRNNANNQFMRQASDVNISDEHDHDRDIALRFGIDFSDDWDDELSDDS